MMIRMNNERKYRLRRQVLLICSVVAIVTSLIWLLQATYNLAPIKQEVFAEQEINANDNFSRQPPPIIWQGNKAYIIAKNTQHTTTFSKSLNEMIGDGRLLYCLYGTQSHASLTNILQKYCLQSHLEEGIGGEEESDESVDDSVVDPSLKSDTDNKTDREDEVEGKQDEPSRIEPNNGGFAGQVYLTFDDGPSHLTASILDVLAETDIVATFFVLGEMVNKHPQLTERIVKDGHGIGNHSYNHRYNELYQSGKVFVDQVIKTSEAIYEATGIATPLFRAPGGTYGNFDKSYMNALNEAGFLTFDWNVDSGDSRSRDVTAEEIIRNVTDAEPKERMMVLMHDSATHEETLLALPAIIEHFHQLNYEFVVINEETEPITSPIAKHIKWKRAALTDKQAGRLKLQTELLLAEAKKAQENNSVTVTDEDKDNDQDKVKGSDKNKRELDGQQYAGAK